MNNTLPTVVLNRIHSHNKLFLHVELSKRMQKSRSCVWEKYQYVITLYLCKYIRVCLFILSETHF